MENYSFPLVRSRGVMFGWKWYVVFKISKNKYMSAIESTITTERE